MSRTISYKSLGNQNKLYTPVIHKSKLEVEEAYNLNQANVSVVSCMKQRKLKFENCHEYQMQGNSYIQNVFDCDQDNNNSSSESPTVPNYFSSLLPFKNSLINEKMRRETVLLQMEDTDNMKAEHLIDNKNIFSRRKAKLNRDSAKCLPEIIAENQLMNQSEMVSENIDIYTLMKMKCPNVFVKSRAIKLNSRNINRSKLFSRKESLLKQTHSCDRRIIRDNTVKLPRLNDQEYSSSEDEHKRCIVLSKVSKHFKKRLN